MIPRDYVQDLNVYVASNEHAAEVIGSNGWKIKLIAMKTSTYIKCPSPKDIPIFCISGAKRDVRRAKLMIESWANNFDQMKSKKRNISMHPGDLVETAEFSRLSVACIIGKKEDKYERSLA